MTAVFHDSRATSDAPGGGSGESHDAFVRRWSRRGRRIVGVVCRACGCTVARAQSPVDGFNPGANDSVNDMAVQGRTGRFWSAAPSRESAPTRNGIGRLTNADPAIQSLASRRRFSRIPQSHQGSTFIRAAHPGASATRSISREADKEGFDMSFCIQPHGHHRRSRLALPRPTAGSR